jgi:hypothetical protein
MPSFGRRYATALKRNYSFLSSTVVSFHCGSMIFDGATICSIMAAGFHGTAGRRDTNGVMLQLKDGRLSNITQF